MTYVETTEGDIKNIYTISLMNKTFSPMDVNLKLESINGKITTPGGHISVPAEGLEEGIISIEIAKNIVESGSMPVKIGIYSKGKKIQTVKTNFMTPIL
jgi:hypothetical protein